MTEDEFRKRDTAAVDLSKAREGDKVTFRCGGHGLISRCEKSERYKDRRFLTFDGYVANGLTFQLDGRPAREIPVPGDGPFDIIAIEPGLFDWATVKPGMAFTDVRYANHIFLYIGPNFGALREKYPDTFYKKLINFSEADYTIVPREALTRAPEHDIPTPRT